VEYTVFFFFLGLNTLRKVS